MVDGGQCVAGRSPWLLEAVTMEKPRHAAGAASPSPLQYEVSAQTPVTVPLASRWMANADGFIY